MRGMQHGARRGAVSIFVVVFTALLITVVTVSFARLMLREQQRSSNSDLSQSAYDAALAGVEDAKRALARVPGLNRDSLRDQCNYITTGLPASDVVTTPEGVRVGNRSLQQWYSCVKVDVLTNDYKGTLSGDETKLVELKGRGNFKKVKVEWFSKEDLSGGTAISVSNETTDMKLLTNDSSDSSVTNRWPDTRPSLLETQMIQTGGGFTMNDMRKSSGSSSNTNTLFLYPTNKTGQTAAFASDARTNKNGAPTGASCRNIDTDGNEYACTAVITIPDPINGSTTNRKNAFLRLTSRYKGAHFRVVLLDESDNIVQFDGVQPEVDSTGRAGDLFRRVRARIEPAGNWPYPEAAVDVTGNFCKSFTVTKERDGYDIDPRCAP